MPTLFLQKTCVQTGNFPDFFFLWDVWALSKPWDLKGNYSDIRSLFQQGNSSIHVCYMINRPWTEDAIPLNLKGSSPLYLSLWSTLVRDAEHTEPKANRNCHFWYRTLQGLSTFFGEPANTVVLDSPACFLKLRANPKVLQRLPGSALEWHILPCQWALSASLR